MNTSKLFHGYRIGGIAHTWDLLAFGAAFRNALEPTYERLYLELATNLAVVWADRILLGETEEEPGGLASARSPWGYAVAYLDEQHRSIRESGLRNLALDLQCQATILGDPEDRERLYALLFTEVAEYRVTWAALPGVEAWAYWDNVDSPDDVPEDAWEERGHTWARVLRGEGAVSRLGLSMELLGSHHHCRLGDDIERITPFIPDRLSRARTVAHRRILAERGERSQPLGRAEWATTIEARAVDIDPTLPDLSAPMLCGPLAAP